MDAYTNVSQHNYLVGLSSGTSAGVASAQPRWFAFRRLLLRSGPENKPRSDGGMDDLVAHLIAGDFEKPIPGAMPGNEIVGIDLLERRDDLPDVVVVQRRNDMKAADNSVHVPDA